MLTCYLLPVIRYPLPVTRYLLPVTRYPLPFTRYPLPVTRRKDLPLLIRKETLTTFQRNILHCWAQHVAYVWPPCCDMLRYVATCWMMLDQI